jgi:F-type H+-transporting ATPase subunit delta
MISGSLARRYAKAAVQIGREHKVLDRIGSDLRALAKMLKVSAELVSSLTNPAIRRVDRRKIVDALLQKIGAAPMSKNLVYLLLDGERMSVLPAISREVDAMIEASAGRVTAEVVSAKPLSDKELQQITVALEKLSGKKVDIHKREDAELLGGVVARVGDIVYDGSLRTQLGNLRDELTK